MLPTRSPEAADNRLQFLLGLNNGLIKAPGTNFSSRKMALRVADAAHIATAQPQWLGAVADGKLGTATADIDYQPLAAKVLKMGDALIDKTCFFLTGNHFNRKRK